MSDVVVHLLHPCRSDECHRSAWKWMDWARRTYRRYPPAMIDLAEDYRKTIGAKGRNMLKKAERNNFIYRRFDYNHRLDDIHKINTSLPRRGGRPMTQSYVDYPVPTSSEYECEHHRSVWVGGFHHGDLVAYAQLYVVRDLAIINRILGHGQHLRGGVMAGLVDALVTTAREQEARWLNYLTMESATDGLSRFKQGVGFRSARVRLGL